MVYSVAWDETTPAGSEVKSLGDNRIREMKAQLRERLDTEHTGIDDSGGDASLMHEWALLSKSTGSPYTVLPSDHILLITTGASTYTCNLPTAVGITGKPYKIKKVDSGVGTVVIDASGSETIDGAATLTLTNQYDFVDIVSNGTNWNVVSKSAVNLDWDLVWSDAAHDHSSAAEGGTISPLLKFLASTTNKLTWTALTDWTDVDISANTGTDTAKAALLAIELDARGPSATWGTYTGLFRKNGSSETAILPRVKGYTTSYSLGYVPSVSACMIIVECDGSEIFEVKLQKEAGDVDPVSISFKVDLIGYFI